MTRNYEVIDDGDEERVHVYSDEVLTEAECDEVYQRLASAPPSPASEAARVVREKLRFWMQKRREARQIVHSERVKARALCNYPTQYTRSIFIAADALENCATYTEQARRCIARARNPALAFLDLPEVPR